MPDKIKTEVNITGMDCADCALHIEKAVKQLPGVEDARVNFMSGKLQLVYDPSLLQEEEVKKTINSAGYGVEEDKHSRRSVLFVKGMDCADEARPIEEKLRKLEGVHEIQFNLIANKLIIEHSIPLEDIQEALRELGFQSELADQAKPSIQKESPIRKLFLYTLLSGVLTIVGGLMRYWGIADVYTIPILLVAIVVGGIHIARKGILEIRNFSLGINFLMTIAVIGAMIIGEWSEGAMVVFLFSLAQLLESLSMDRARRSIQSLMQLSPKIAHVKVDETIRTVPVERISIGETIIIKPGERIPLDGVVTAGKSYVDQSPITGESTPVKKQKGATVFAGSINQNGTLEVEVTHPYTETTLSRIIHLVEEAQAKKAPMQQFVEKFARYYTPAVVVLAILIAIIPPLFFSASLSEWFYRALVLLVISCPCALVISTPVTLVSALTNAARNGILIKGGAYLEKFDTVDVLALDKTGTVTVGKPRVHKIITVNGASKEELLSIAASMESRSEHPLAEAILQYARRHRVTPSPVGSFEALTGRGIRGEIGGKTYFLGNHRLFEESGWCDEQIHPYLEKFKNQQHTAVILGSQEKVLGVIAIADAPRKGAAEAIQRLRKAGVKKFVMVTGDNQSTAEAIARELGIDEVRAELLPEDKVKVIQELKAGGQCVAMVGDGINDAPALATADIGVSMGASATDTALETADITLMNDDLTKLAVLKKLSRKTLRIIQQNIFLALFLKGIFVVLAIPGLATLWMAVFADMGASLLVVFNGLRVLGNRN